MRKYQERVSGPLLDRIDIQVHVKPVPHERLAVRAESETSTEAVRGQVLAARDVQERRQGGCNAALRGSDLDRLCALHGDTRELLAAAMDRLSLSARAYHRILRVARTIADLEAVERIDSHHIAESIQYRALEGK
ncbi:MAG: ATP-binding protein [Proteobacteria bacterium]|nr:MAG: ATP-binding protein [Pseudomonadota bacterium]